MATKKTAAKKSAAKKSAAKKSAAKKKNGAAPQISVRMYRQGLGDCFLITFSGASSKPFYMLIDCGAVLGTPDPSTKMAKVLDDVAAVTGGHIDLLVATHEHWDHVSGFVQVRDRFDKLTIGEVWVAWTEDPSDAL